MTRVRTVCDRRSGSVHVRLALSSSTTAPPATSGLLAVEVNGRQTTTDTFDQALAKLAQFGDRW